MGDALVKGSEAGLKDKDLKDTSKELAQVYQSLLVTESCNAVNMANPVAFC